MRRFAPLCAAIALAAAAPASGQTTQAAPTDPPFPYEQLAENVVGITPPAGWRVAHMDFQGVIAELGEVMPVATTDPNQWRDLLAYMTVANSTGATVSDLAEALSGVAGHCIASATFRQQPQAVSAGEDWGEIACRTAPGANSNVAAPLEIYVFRTARARDANFRFWRAWRGTPDEALTMLRAHGVTRPPRVSAEPTQAELQALASVMPTLVSAWSQQLTQTFEVCDLSAAPCASLNRTIASSPSLPAITSIAPLSTIAGIVSVRGDRTDMQAMSDYYNRRFGSPPPDNTGIGMIEYLRPSRHEYQSARRTFAFGWAMIMANKGSGGVFFMGGEAPLITENDAGRMRAYLLKVARQMTKYANGSLPYDAYTFDLWPNE